MKKSLSTRTHFCQCGCVLDRDGKCLDGVQPVVDHNAAINILNLALGTTGHVGTWINHPNASGDLSATVLGESLSQQLRS